MPTYNVTLAGGATASVIGTRPFSKEQTGGPSGAFSIEGNGEAAVVTLGTETADVVFAETDAGIALVDSIVAAANNSPAVTSAAAITGTKTVGQTLTVAATFTGTPTPAKTYQWFADGVVIEGAAAATYVLTEDEEGALITAKVTGTNTHGSVTSTSAATTAIAAE